jgi:hypothetical protein
MYCVCFHDINIFYSALTSLHDQSFFDDPRLARSNILKWRRLRETHSGSNKSGRVKL